MKKIHLAGTNGGRVNRTGTRPPHIVSAASTQPRDFKAPGTRDVRKGKTSHEHLDGVWKKVRGASRRED